MAPASSRSAGRSKGTAKPTLQSLQVGTFHPAQGDLQAPSSDRVQPIPDTAPPPSQPKVLKRRREGPASQREPSEG